MSEKLNKHIIFIFGTLILLNFYLWSLLTADYKPMVRFMDIGQGDSILIQDGFNQVLVDGGPSSETAQKISRQMPYFDRAVDLVVITHFDKDHYNGIFEVANKFKIGAVAYHLPELDKPNAAALIALLEEKKIPVIKPVAGQTLRVGEIALEVMHPFLGQQTAGNDRSIVLRYGEQKVLLTGDIGEVGERVMLKAYGSNLNSEILKVPHHGSKNNLLPDFLRKIDPKIAIISVGSNNYGHPSQLILDKLSELKVFRTDQDGDVTYYPDQNKIESSN